MGLINVSLPTDGTTADVADYNTPIQTIVDEINGQLDNDNLASDAAIAGSKLANGAITPNKLDLDPSTAEVATSQTTTSTTYDNLATTGPEVTVTIGNNGLALMIISLVASNSNAAQNCLVTYAASGANTVAAADANSLLWNFQSGAANQQAEYSYVGLLTGLSAGSTTFTLKYRVSANTGTFARRRITVIPL